MRFDPLPSEFYTQIGRTVIAKMKNRKISIRELSVEMTDEGYFNSHNTASEFITRVRMGRLGDLISPIRKRSYHIPEDLERLAYLFSKTDIQEKDPIVEEIKRNHPYFPHSFRPNQQYSYKST